MQALRWHARQPHPNARFRLSCSACFCQIDYNFHCQLRKPRVRGVVTLWTPLDATEPRALGQVVSRSGPLPSSEWWHESSGRLEPYLRDMNIRVSSGDERREEVLAHDLPCFGGAQLAVDAKLVSVLCSSGEPQPHAAEVDGVVLKRARHVKEATYPELAASERCRLVVLATETGGRWSEEAVHMVRQLAIALMSRQRCSRTLATSCAVAFAASLVEPSKWCDTWCHTGGTAPGLADLLAQDSRQSL